MNLKQKLMNFIFSGAEVDELKVKHFEVTSKNTFTTPKIVCTDASADPLVNGEIQLNGTTLKGKRDGTVRNF